MKVVAVAPHHLIYIHLIYPIRLLDIVNFGVGYCFIHTTGNARAGFQDKADIVPTPFFLVLTAYFRELVGITTSIMNLKRVVFTLKEEWDLSYDPYATEQELKESNERLKERDGLLHCWQDSEEKSPQSENYLIKKVALIEDLETGKIHEIRPQNIRIIND